MQFLKHTKCNEFRLNMPIIIDFLFLYQDTYRREYRTTTYKCAIALPLKYAIGLDIMCPTLELFMRGTFSVRPPLKAKLSQRGRSTGSYNI